MPRVFMCNCGRTKGGTLTSLISVPGTKTLLQNLPPGEFIEVPAIAAIVQDEAAPSAAVVAEAR